MANHFPDLMKNKFMDPRIIANCMQGKYNHTKTHQSQNDDILRQKKILEEDTENHYFT